MCLNFAIPDTKSAAVWRFWAELIPLLSVIGFTIIFWLIDKRNIRLHLTGKPVYNIVLGCITGAIWLGVSVVILSLTGVIHINGRNQFLCFGYGYFQLLSIALCRKC